MVPQALRRKECANGRSDSCDSTPTIPRISNLPSHLLFFPHIPPSVPPPGPFVLESALLSASHDRRLSPQLLGKWCPCRWLTASPNHFWVGNRNICDPSFGIQPELKCRRIDQGTRTRGVPTTSVVHPTLTIATVIVTDGAFQISTGTETGTVIEAMAARQETEDLLDMTHLEPHRGSLPLPVYQKLTWPLAVQPKAVSCI